VENNLVRGMTGDPAIATSVRAFRQAGYDNRFGKNVIRYNTFDHRTATGAAVYFDGTSSVVGTSLIGNLILGNGSAPSVWVRDSSSTGAISTHSYNTYWPASSATPAYRIGYSGGLTAGQIVASWEPTAIQQGPVFESGYMLSSGAAQLDRAGAACASTDIYSHNRPYGAACDVGAAERVPAASSAVVPPVNLRALAD
jgi:hypothetical protein